MGEVTNIEWADSTLNVWEGCQKTGSLACEICYAEARNLRYAPKGTTEAPNWGPHAPRREVKSWRATLRKISRMALAAKAAGRTEPWFVFVNSLSDFWDNQADAALRREALIEFAKHPHLTFLLLTKRPQNIVKMWEVCADPIKAAGGWVNFPRNVAIGCTVVTQEEASRDVPWLLRAKAALRPAFAFLSMEPLVEIVRLLIDNGQEGYDFLTGHWYEMDDPAQYIGSGGGGGRVTGQGTALDWVITGGGTDQGKHKAYPTPTEAFESLRDQCATAGVAFFMKQMTRKAPIPSDLLIREKPVAA